MMDIKGKTALITGAGGGIGRATSTAFATAGADRIILVDNDTESVAETARLVRDAGATPVVEVIDVSDITALIKLFERIEVQGGLDIVLNNAGVGSIHMVPHTPPERIEKVVAVNLTAVIMGTQLATNSMARRDGGAIVNVSSMVVTFERHDDPIYAATKAAVLKFGQCCASLMETHNVRVNTVLPCLVDAAMRQPQSPERAARRRAMVARGESVSPETVARAVLDIVRDEGMAGQHVMIEPTGLRSGRTLKLEAE